jgi:hypothetical protein
MHSSKPKPGPQPSEPRLPHIQDQLAYTLEEAAAKLRQRTSWPVRTLIREGKLKPVWVGREQIIYHAELVRFLADNAKAA